MLVVGGGSSGLAAAVAAARLGCEVMLAERNGYLGGTLAMVTLGSICGLYTVTDYDVIPVVRGFAGEFVEQLRRIGGTKGPQRWLKTASLPYDPPSVRLVADEVILSAGVRPVFHSLAVDVIKDTDRLNGVIFESRDGRWACFADVTIDCTGDGDVAALAGANFDHDPDVIQTPTSMFRFGGVDTERTSLLSRDDLRSHLEQAVEAGLPLPRTAGGMFSLHPGTMHVNITRVLRGSRAPDPLDTEELTEAEMEGRRQVRLYLEAFQRFVPGFENCFIADLGEHIGVRESRRIRGEYWLSLDDVLHEGRFSDAIACSAWPVEEHAQDRTTKWVFLKPGTYYQLPFRMMLPVGLDALLVAGRCASASHEAHASMRVAGVCMALGEAAGVAAAQAVSSRKRVRDIEVASLRSQLIRQGAFLGEDPAKPLLGVSPSGIQGW